MTVGRFILATIAIIFFSATASAQEMPASDTTPKYLKISIGVFAGAAAADDASTWYFSNYHRDWLSERNPLVSGLDRHPIALTAAIASIDVTGAWAWKRYVGRKHPRLAAVGFYAAAGLRTWFAIHNIRNIANAPPSAPPAPPGWKIPMAPWY